MQEEAEMLTVSKWKHCLFQRRGKITLLKNYKITVTISNKTLKEIIILSGKNSTVTNLV